MPDLPDSFDGFRIVQVSDIHTGSFLSTEPLERAVNMINEQKPDIVFFTGDLVNYNHMEALDLHRHSEKDRSNTRCIFHFWKS